MKQGPFDYDDDDDNYEPDSNWNDDFDCPQECVEEWIDDLADD